MSSVALLIFSLATWRAASLLVQEDGPFFVFRKLRELAGITHDDEGDILMVPETFFGGVLSCVWCCSVWVALAWFAFWMLSPQLAELCALPFAFSAGAIVVNRIAG